MISPRQTDHDRVADTGSFGNLRPHHQLRGYQVAIAIRSLSITFRNQLSRRVATAILGNQPPKARSCGGRADVVRRRDRQDLRPAR
jgi:hypothetical protein